MSTNSRIIERSTRHQVMIQRLGSSQVKALLPILKSMARDIRLRILDEPTEFQLNRLNLLLLDIKSIINDTGARFADDLFDGMADFAEYEAGFTQRLMAPLINVDTTLPASEQIRAALTRVQARVVSGNQIKSLTIRQMVDQFTESKRRGVEVAVRAGFIEGQTTQQIASNVQRITGVQAPRQAETLIRTATNHAGSVAREAFYAENGDVIAEEEWVATLDARTTIICASRDGQKYPVGQGPQTPAHFNCRSLRVAVVKPEFTLFGEDPGQRASMDGPVSANKTYSGWLRDQSAEFQNDVLGPERAKLFRSGKVTLDGFVDDMGRMLTLDELRAREGLTFG